MSVLMFSVASMDYMTGAVLSSSVQSSHLPGPRGVKLKTNSKDFHLGIEKICGFCTHEIGRVFLLLGFALIDWFHQRVKLHGL